MFKNHKSFFINIGTYPRLASAFCEIWVSKIAVTWRRGIFLKCNLFLRILIKNLWGCQCCPSPITLMQGFEEKELKNAAPIEFKERVGAITTTAVSKKNDGILSRSDDLSAFKPARALKTSFGEVSFINNDSCTRFCKNILWWKKEWFMELGLLVFSKLSAMLQKWLLKFSLIWERECNTLSLTLIRVGEYVDLLLVSSEFITSGVARGAARPGCHHFGVTPYGYFIWSPSFIWTENALISGKDLFFWSSLLYQKPT